MGPPRPTPVKANPVNPNMRTQRSRQCPIWLGLAALLLGFSAPAVGQSSIVYGRFPPTTVPPPAAHFPQDDQGTRLFPGLTQASTYPLAFNGQVFYTFAAAENGFTISPMSSIEAIIAVPVGQLGGGFAIALGAGQEIGPDAQAYFWMSGPAPWLLMGCVDFGCRGFFVGTDSAYVGLRFQQSGQTYYGWVRVGAPFSAPDGGLNGGWLYDYAFETRPGVSIKAGAKSVMVAVAVPVVARPGFLRLSWLSEIGKAYQVQAKPGLDALTWTNLNFAVPATTTNTLLDLPMIGAAQFFRVVAAD